MPDQPFYYGNPELYQQQQTLQRQQMLANALQDQAQQPMTPGSWNSMPVVPRAGFGTFTSKLAQMLGSAALQKQIVQGQTNLYGKQLDYATDLMTPHTLTRSEAAQKVLASGGGMNPDAGDAVDAVAGTKTPSPYNPMGWDPRTAARMALQNPDQFNQRIQQLTSPTEGNLALLQQGGNLSLAGAAANQANATKASMTEISPHYFRMADGSIRYLPDVPPNANVQNVNPSTLQVSGVSPVSGSANAMANNAFGPASGSAQGAAIQTINERGQPQLDYAKGSPFEGVAGPTMTPNSALQPGGPIAGPAVPAAGMRRTIVTGQSQTQTGMQANAGQRLAADRAAQDDIAQTQTGLENALKLTESGQFNAGPGSSSKYNWMAVAKAIPGLQWIPGDTDGYQSVQKYLANSLGHAAAGSGLTGSNEKFETLMSGNPNAEHMGNVPLADAIRYVLSQQDAAKARYGYVAKRAGNGADAGAVSNAYDGWAGAYSNGGARYFEATRQPVVTSSDGVQIGQLAHTPRGVMRRVAGGWEPVSAPQ